MARTLRYERDSATREYERKIEAAKASGVVPAVKVLIACTCDWLPVPHAHGRAETKMSVMRFEAGRAPVKKSEIIPEL